MPPRLPDRPASSRFLLRIAAAALGVLVGGCRDRAPERGQAPRVTITVSAAASLREVIAELDSAYQAEHPEVAVRANFGASGALRQQIEQGAPVDVFISASDRHMDALQQGGLVD